MKTKPLQFVICIVIVSLLSQDKIFSQGFQTKEVSDKIWIVTNPDLGNQVVVQSAKGLLIFDSFWSVKTARLFKEDIIKTMQRNDFSYVINMVDRLDMFGGNAAYQEAVIVGHENILTKYSNEKLVKAELTELIDMWRYKEEISHNRLEDLEEGSDKAKEEQDWMNMCKSRADELEYGFSLALPQILYKDKMTLKLEDITINLIWFGEAGNYGGLSMAIIPEERLAILNKAIIYPMLHLAPYVHPDFGVLDVSRWIAMFEEMLEGDNAVDKIILSDDDRVYSREEWLSHLKYIRMLWESVRTADAEGMTLQEIQEQLSLDRDFAFVKEMLAYKNSSDAWIRPQHELHIKQFYLQNKSLASEILKEGGPESLQASLKNIREAGSDLYFDEMYINRIGYSWMSKGYHSEAIEVFKLNAEAFPQSFNVYDSLGEAYMKIGDTKNATNNYKKSLDLNPDNNNAKNNLEKLEAN